MKTLYYIILVSLFWGISASSFAQERQRRQRPGEVSRDSGLPELSVRAQSKNEDQTNYIDRAAWLKEIYRWIDLTKEVNAPLYYPVQPIGDRMNLFTLIFKLMSDRKIQAYKYIDGQEVFTDDNAVNFEDVLKVTETLYETEKRGGEDFYIVQNSDIPSGEVTLYMVKEAWFFNQANGLFERQVLALCPMLVREDYDLGGEETRTPLFWLPYENIRPYISRNLIMTSNMNNALTYTTDDFFQKGMYDGEIIKTTNLMNLTLQQQYGDSIKVGQDSIESQLKFFEAQLWIPEDTTAVDDKKKDKKEKKESASRGSSNDKEEKKEKKSSKPKAEKSSSSGPTKSVRRTR